MRLRRPRRSGLVGWLVLAGAALWLGACSPLGDSSLPQDSLDPAGPVARAQDNLWDVVFGVATVVFIIVQLGILYAVFRFRSKGNETTLPRQVHGNTRLEVIWTLVPALILAGIAVPTVQTIFELSDEPPDAVQVEVVAKQYFFMFKYTGEEPGDIWTANELVMPTGRPVFLTLRSLGQQNDPAGVMHNFWIPRLAGKQYNVPGHENTMSLQADEPGVYLGECAEFCGLSHANMRLRAIAMPPDEFDAWLAEQAEPADEPDDALAQEGQEQFVTATCIACHSIEGHPAQEDEGALVGPPLTHFASRDYFAGAILQTNEENLRAWLRNPQAAKPGAQMPNLNLSEEQIDALVAYLLTLN